MPQANHSYLAWAEIDLKAIRHNFLQIRRLAERQQIEQLPGRRRKAKSPAFPEILTVIKADAYGHGMIRVAQTLNTLRVKFFGVSDVPEGVLLRKNGIKKRILLLETALPTHVKEIVDYDLTPTVCTVSLAAALNAYAKKTDRRLAVHIKVDTGMGRMGVWHRDAAHFIREVARYSHLSVEGICSHFPLADSNPDFTRSQVQDLTQLVKELDQSGLIVPYIHAANSAGLARYQTLILNVVRPGLLLYGLYSDPENRDRIKLRPAMRVRARVIFVKQIAKGQGISYGHTFVAPRDMTVATIPMGYSDGYFRSLSNKSSVLIGGERCPVLGRVTMDQIVVDVTHLKQVRIGQDVVILGRQRDAVITADELAEHAGTINYEIVCNLGNRLPRVYR